MDKLEQMTKRVVGGFIPGLFLFVHLYGFLLVMLSGTDTSVQAVPMLSLNDSITTSIVALVFGYLLGVLLRALQCERVDKYSARYLRMKMASGKIFKMDFLDPEKRKRLSVYPDYLTDRFPYFEYLKSVCEENFPEAVSEFFEAVWQRQTPDTGKHNRQYFNLCKSVLNSIDPRGAAEIHEAENLCRYMAQMFYALILSSALLVAVLASATMSIVQIPTGLLVAILFVLSVYLLFLGVVLSQYRWMRIKEAEVVLAVCFVNRDKLQSLLSGDDTEEDENKKP